MSMIRIQKTRDVKTPTRGTDGSAGLDFYVPNDFGAHIVYNNNSILIPSGIICKIPEGHALIAMNKSGIATKHNLIVGACVVDQDYQGEIHLHLVNVGDFGVWVTPGMKLVQFLLIPVNFCTVEVVKSAWDDQITGRGHGKMGSTDELDTYSIQQLYEMRRMYISQRKNFSGSHTGSEVDYLDIRIKQIGKEITDRESGLARNSESTKQ